MKGEIRDALEEARRRTWRLVDLMDDAMLESAAATYLSPPVWDLGHIANFEELWLVQRLQGQPEMHAGDNKRYDAFENPRPDRPKLHLLDRDGVRAYLDDVRASTLAGLDALELGPSAPRLLRDGFVYWMLVLHEGQHQETLLQSLQMRRQLRGGAKCSVDIARPVGGDSGLLDQGSGGAEGARDGNNPRDAGQEDWCRVPAGQYTVGANLRPGVYDNESPAHQRDVAAFEIARLPVTNGEWLAFIEAGGYSGDAFARGYSGDTFARGRKSLEAAAPLHWRERATWERFTHADGWVPISRVADEIVCHVSYFEAEAYAAWAGARLPTETEWEVACRGLGAGGLPEPGIGGQAYSRTMEGITLEAHGVGRERQAPAHQPPITDAKRTIAARAEWPRGNHDQSCWKPSRVGEAGSSWCGAQHMLGDVWEWTSSTFDPYPGFEAFPYDAYSKVFFGGDYRVLRGGSWATRAACATPTFRNWDHPYRRQIFSGLRLARDG